MGTTESTDSTPVPPPPAGPSPEISTRSLALMKDAPRRKAANTRSPLGTNLPTPDYSSRDWMFVNRMMGARTFVSVGMEWDDKRPLPLDTHGFPTRLLPDQHAVTLVPTYDGGHSILTYEGQGEIALEASDGSVKVLDEKPGRIEFTVSRDQQLHLRIRSTKEGDHVRNIRVVPKALEKSTAVFHPLYLERLAPFKVLRFMDWARTNHQTLSSWEDRSTPDSFTQSLAQGVAYEYMVRLGNILRADIWLCVPHQADDALVQGMAELVAAGLDKDLKVYVEYSNEIWNGIFDQAKYAIEQGKKLGLARDDFQAGARFQSQRSVEIFKIFERAFADRPGTLVRVMGSQVGNAWHHGVLLEHRDAMKHVDALAVAPYFGHGWGTPDQVDMIKKTTTDRLIKMVETRSMDEAKEALAGSAAYAKKVKKPLIAYEGGQHIIASMEVHNDVELDEKLNELQRHPYMADLYADLLGAWKGAGGQLFVHFTMVEIYSKWSKFGALEFQDQPRAKAPKFDALMTFIEKNPAWW